ncbi:MAG: Hemerythrin cation binding protein [Cyanobacteria bacterium RYN_339]|nr:Hemerythrin cation binding protein [Cyanobacteria bacterium RYN_339]
MSHLIERLTEDHVGIVSALEHVKESGIASVDGKQKLFSVKAHLIAHLRREDDELYPMLKRAGEMDVNLKRTIDIFAKDMEIVSSLAMGFFDKYSQGSTGLDLARDFGKLYTILKTRIRKEEDILYLAYTQVSSREPIGL